MAADDITSVEEATITIAITAMATVAIAICDGSTKGVSQKRHLLNAHQLQILN
jgi:hypothetical protein